MSDTSVETLGVIFKSFFIKPKLPPNFICIDIDIYHVWKNMKENFRNFIITGHKWFKTCKTKIFMAASEERHPTNMLVDTVGEKWHRCYKKEVRTIQGGSKTIYELLPYILCELIFLYSLPPPIYFIWSLFLFWKWDYNIIKIMLNNTMSNAN